LRIQKQAARCNFGDQLKIQMRNRIVAGINNVEIQKRLLAEPKLTYDGARKILDAAHSVEQAAASVSFQGNSSTVLFGNKFRGKKLVAKNSSTKKFSDSNKTGHTQTNNWHTQNNIKLNPCYSCGLLHNRNTCKFRQAKCHACGRIGHIAKVCRKAKESQVKLVENNTDSKANPATSDADPENNVVLSIMNSSPMHVTQDLYLDDKKISFILDTGSPVNIVDKQILPSRYKLIPQKTQLKGISGHSVSTEGYVNLSITHNGKSYLVKFHVIQNGVNLLGLEGMRTLKINLSTIFSVELNSITDLIHAVSNNSGKLQIPPVKLVCSSEAKFIHSRPIPFGLREAVQSNLTSLCETGILEKVSHSRWATPIVVVRKANGSVRICGDYRLTVNSQIHQVACTTPEPEDLFSTIQGSTVFSKIDLSNAFLQVPLETNSRELTTINTPFGLYRYCRLPFGLSVSPGIFQQVINKILSGISGALAYQDDILIHGNGIAEHDHVLKQTLERLCKMNVKINSKKSVFQQTSMPYLGYLISEKGISPDPDRIKAIRSAAVPKSSNELRSILGLFQYYSRFIANFSTIAEPLFAAVNSNPFCWDLNQDKAFNLLIQKITSRPILGCFQFREHSTLIVDASETGIGGVLEQLGHPIICISRRLSVSERGYAQTQKEALAIVWCVKRLHKYLYGKKFTIVSDHESLSYIFNPKKSVSKCTSAMLTRWAITLSAYSYDIEHRPGKRIPQSDFLSRGSYQEDPPDKQIHFLSHLPINRNKLMLETKLAFRPILAALKNGWSLSAKKSMPLYYKNRAEFSLSPDGIIFFNDTPLIPPTCRKDILDFLHSGHLGIEKMKSLARMCCYWPEMTNDIVRTYNSCEKCLMKPKTSSNLKPWPVSFKPMQRIHADYCGPFLSKYYCLIIIDSYSRYPEIFITTRADADFTRKAFQKFFSREGVPQCIITDNGTHFNAELLIKWVKGVGSNIIYTAPRHPQSNGLAENFVRTTKVAIKAAEPKTLEELENTLDNFLFQYRNATHSTTLKTPAMLFKGRNLRSSLNFDTTEVYFKRGNDLRPSKGLIINTIGKRMFNIIDLSDGSIHRRHLDQVSIGQNKNNEEKHNTEEISMPSNATNNPVMAETERLLNESPLSFQPTEDNASTPKKNTIEREPNELVSRRSTRIRKPPERFRIQS